MFDGPGVFSAWCGTVPQLAEHVRPFVSFMPSPTADSCEVLTAPSLSPRPQRLCLLLQQFRSLISRALKLEPPIHVAVVTFNHDVPLVRHVLQHLFPHQWDRIVVKVGTALEAPELEAAGRDMEQRRAVALHLHSSASHPTTQGHGLADMRRFCRRHPCALRAHALPMLARVTTGRGRPPSQRKGGRVSWRARRRT